MFLTTSTQNAVEPREAPPKRKRKCKKKSKRKKHKGGNNKRNKGGKKKRRGKKLTHVSTTASGVQVMRLHDVMSDASAHPPPPEDCVFPPHISHTPTKTTNGCKPIWEYFDSTSPDLLAPGRYQAGGTEVSPSSRGETPPPSTAATVVDTATPPTLPDSFSSGESTSQLPVSQHSFGSGASNSQLPASQHSQHSFGSGAASQHSCGAGASTSQLPASQPSPRTPLRKRPPRNRSAVKRVLPTQLTETRITQDELTVQRSRVSTPTPSV